MLVATACLTAACQSHDGVVTDPNAFAVSNELVTLNPSGYAPLAATIHVETAVPATVRLRVLGKHGSASDVVKAITTANTVHNIPVLGLYPDFANTVEVTFATPQGSEVGKKTYTLRTAALPTTTYPVITIDTRRDSVMADGMTLVSYFGSRDGSLPMRPFIFDRFGDIRWCLDYSTSAVLNRLFYDDGVERLQNGNFYFGDISSNAIYEVDMFGAVVNTWALPGYKFHHQVLEKPNGNLLVTATSLSASTEEDFIIEIDRTTRQIVRTWDLRMSLQIGRRTLTANVADWLHVNAIAWDPSDTTIIVSGRTQALVKLDQDNHVVWIMGAHRGWGTAGDGTDLRSVLLQPFDRSGVAITDAAVLDGSANHPDFEWNWYQHAPKVMPNGHILLFDNGDNRNFSAGPRYSRAVEYAVDSRARTVRQVWTYGKSRGTETYSRIVSDVDLIAGGTHVVVTPGAISNGTESGKVIELDYATQQVLFEATLVPPISFFTITMHRTERLSLYP